MAKEPTTTSADKGETKPPAAAEAGTAAQAAQAADKPVVLGSGPVPVVPGGPGAGAARIAQEATGAVSAPLGGDAETALGLRPRGDAAGTALGLAGLAPLTEAERLELAGYRGGLSEADLRLIGDRFQLETFRRLQNGAGASTAALPGAGVVVDAAAAPGRRRAKALTAIQRDGVLYAPDAERKWVPVDFAAYTELVGIGAIERTPWDELDDDTA